MSTTTTFLHNTNKCQLDWAKSEKGRLDIQLAQAEALKCLDRDDPTHLACMADGELGLSLRQKY